MDLLQESSAAVLGAHWSAAGERQKIGVALLVKGNWAAESVAHHAASVCYHRTALGLLQQQTPVPDWRGNANACCRLTTLRLLLGWADSAAGGGACASHWGQTGAQKGPVKVSPGSVSRPIGWACLHLQAFAGGRKGAQHCPRVKKGCAEGCP